MSQEHEDFSAFRVRPGKKLKLKEHDPAWDGDDHIPMVERRAFAEEALAEDIQALSKRQEELYASNTWALLIIFQAMDAAGKDSTIKHVMSGINPQGCHVTSFKQPSHEELGHDFLWRAAKALPERGKIGIFNRSHYEEVLVVKVHPEFLAAQRLPHAEPKKSFWRRRYESINHFEDHLTRNGTAVIKFFLNVSRDEQRRRFLERIEKPEKRWKFNAQDITERAHWDEYMAAYERALSATSSKRAPWYVIPADHKWICRGLVAKIVLKTLKELDLRHPEPDAAQTAVFAAARDQLIEEKN